MKSTCLKATKAYSVLKMDETLNTSLLTDIQQEFRDELILNHLFKENR